ncbi:uncharacterized protein LOC129907626 isoform X2 [Episyrphus balteatus]|uniref:uncharacterized protein LOC129907626 isoform X2 n=1 Tax=Episyrphus balteatus TaxID=286459 RepID=UPI0024863CBA|nr:uncharacterized protein LOC129907626 isoform X2 [Episyrphus balteatus]
MQNEKTSTQQHERMVNLMSEYPDIAQNYTKKSSEIVALFWEDLANQLNAIGPRQRDAGGWKKVWSDYKCYIKKKVVGE